MALVTIRARGTFTDGDYIIIHTAKYNWSCSAYAALVLVALLSRLRNSRTRVEGGGRSAAESA